MDAGVGYICSFNPNIFYLLKFWRCFILLSMKQLLILILTNFVILALSADAAKEDTRSSEALINEIVLQLEKDLKTANKKLQSRSEEEQLKAQESIVSYNQALAGIKRLQSPAPSHNRAWDAYALGLSDLARMRGGFSDEYAELIHALTQAIEREKAKALKELEKELATFKEGLGVILLAATDPSDLDTLFVKLDAFKVRANRFPSHRHNFDNTCRNLGKIVAGWQDYLNNLKIGDFKQAEYSLKNLNQSLDTYPVIPRSKVLELQNELKRKINMGQKSRGTDPVSPPFSVREVVKEIKTIEDMVAAKEKLELLTRYRETQHEANYQLGAIRDLQYAIDLIDNGNALLGLSAVNRFSPNNSLGKLWCGAIRSLIRQRALYESVPEAFRPRIDKEAIELVIEKSAGAMSERAAWVELWEFLKVVTQTGFNNSGHSSRNILPGFDNDIRAIEHFTYAQRLEETGQLAEALVRYNMALNIMGRFGPYDSAKKATVRLLVTRAEELLADQKRIAEIPRPVLSNRYPPIHPRLSHDLNNLMRNPEFKKSIEDLIALQITMHLAKEATDKDETESKKEAAEK